MKKVTSLSLPKEQVDLILRITNSPEGEESAFEFRRSKRGLDLYVKN